jgi:hypothetical protein
VSHPLATWSGDRWAGKRLAVGSRAAVVGVGVVVAAAAMLSTWWDWEAAIHALGRLNG